MLSCNCVLVGKLAFAIQRVKRRFVTLSDVINFEQYYIVLIDHTVPMKLSSRTVQLTDTSPIQVHGMNQVLILHD